MKYLFLIFGLLALCSCKSGEVSSNGVSHILRNDTVVTRFNYQFSK